MLHVVVVGAGVFGVWTAHHLHASGARVTLIDAYGPANPRASSSDQSRIIRCGYGADEIYSRLARQSLPQWQALAVRASDRLPIWHQSGVLFLTTEDDPYLAATRQTLDRAGYPFEILDAARLRSRYPHLDTTGITIALVEPDCGVLMARRSVRVLASELVTAGVRLIRDRVASPSSGTLRTVTMTDGAVVEGDRFVFACGPWLPALFPSVVGSRIRPTRQTVIYFGTPPGDVRFGPRHTPAWLDRPEAIYGVPELEDGGLKVGIDEHGPPIDPDTDDRVPDAGSIARAREWVHRRFPAMKDAPVVRARVCQYENTSNGDFLIDRHPEFDNAWLVGGGSGHGFKHGPAVGEHAARLVLTGSDTDPRFALASKGVHAARTVF